MTDFRLKVFLAVVRNQSFTKAAQELFITQPAVTKHIRELEEMYQTRLFDRRGGRIALTDAGRLLKTHSERIMDGYKQLEFAMNQLHADCASALDLGASTTLSEYVLPPLLARFVAKYPKASIRLINCNTHRVEQALESHDIDIGMVEGVSHRSGLKYTPFMEDELVAVVPADSRLGLPDEIASADLTHIPLVLREHGSGTLDVIERALAGHGIDMDSLNVVMQLGSTEGIKRFLEHKDCMGIVSIHSIDKELAAGRFRVVEIKDMPMPRQFSFVQRQGSEEGLAKVFVEFALRESM